MARTRVVHRCRDCGAETPTWVGRCPSCGEWSSLEEVAEAAPAAGPGPRRPVGIVASEPAAPLAEIDTGSGLMLPTGVAELDRVLGGGLAADAVTLLGGEPGIGKSTLLLQLAEGVAAHGCRVLHLTGEEGRAQVRGRAERLGLRLDNIWLAATSSLAEALGHLDDVAPDVVLVDSVQTLQHPEVSGAPGSVAQVRECTQVLVAEAKARHLAVVLVGHVTKDGGLAGPRTLEHLVDTVLSFEGDRHHQLRLLRAVKHRFGSTRELGLFEMTGSGLVGVVDPSSRFLGDRRPGVEGSVVVPVIEGHRPLLAEVQALVVDSPLPQPRRTAQGLDSGRLSLLLAVLSRSVGVDLRRHDVHAVATGGVKVGEPAADLGLALALVSSHSGRPLRSDLVACGEVGLAGEVRRVGHLERRLHEAARLGFRHAVVPASSPPDPEGMTLHRVTTLGEAVEQCALLPVAGAPLSVTSNGR